MGILDGHAARVLAYGGDGALISQLTTWAGRNGVTNRLLECRLLVAYEPHMARAALTGIVVD